MNTEARQIAECKCPTCGQFNGLGFEPAVQEKIAALEARCAALEQSLGAHIQADACRSVFPDDDADAAQLKKQETWWRLTARSWIDDAISDECAYAAKRRAVSEDKSISALTDNGGRTDE